MKPIIFLDLDGVCVDFVGGVTALLKRRVSWTPGEYDLAKAFGVTDRDLWQEITHAGMAFWQYLNAYTWFRPLLGMLSSLAPVFFASSPGTAHTVGPAVAGKMSWLQWNASGYERSFVFTPSKEILAQPRAILVDDSDANVDAFRTFGGKAVLFPQIWNSRYSDIVDDRIEKVVREVSRYVIEVEKADETTCTAGTPDTGSAAPATNDQPAPEARV